MKYIILTNFDDYDYNFRCDENGILTFQLIPKFKKDILLKDNIFLKKGATCFRKKYCTIYKKTKSEFLFKFTNHKHSNSYDKQKLDLLEFDIPTKYHSVYKSKFRQFKENYYNYKIKKLDKKCFDLRCKIYN